MQPWWGIWEDLSCYFSHQVTGLIHLKKLHFAPALDQVFLDAVLCVRSPHSLDTFLLLWHRGGTETQAVRLPRLRREWVEQVSVLAHSPIQPHTGSSHTPTCPCQLKADVVAGTSDLEKCLYDLPQPPNSSVHNYCGRSTYWINDAPQLLHTFFPSISPHYCPTLCQFFLEK